MNRLEAINNMNNQCRVRHSGWDPGISVTKIRDEKKHHSEWLYLIDYGNFTKEKSYDLFWNGYDTIEALNYGWEFYYEKYEVNEKLVVIQSYFQQRNGASSELTEIGIGSIARINSIDGDLITIDGMQFNIHRVYLFFKKLDKIMHPEKTITTKLSDADLTGLSILFGLHYIWNKIDKKQIAFKFACIIVLYFIVYILQAIITWQIKNPFQWIIDLPTYSPTERFWIIVAYLEIHICLHFAWIYKRDTEKEKLTKKQTNL